MGQKKKNIMVWGASVLVTEGLKALLENTGSYRVICADGSREQLLDVSENERPNVLVIDTSEPEFNGSALKEIKDITASPVILLLLDSINRTEFHKYKEAGVENLLLKNSSREEILNAVESAANNRKNYSSGILETILESLEPKSQAVVLNNLTPSEMEIVRLIAGGLTTKQIAARRNVSFHTVNTHRKNVFRKLKVSNASELTMKAIKAGWIDNIEYYI